MASVKESQRETIANIDTAKALVDKVVSALSLMESSPSLSLTFATNPIGFLMQMLKELGMSYEELRLWLTNFLIYVLPSLEISVKSILLTNLKHMVSCSVDARIPEKYRKIHKTPNSSESSQEYGIDIDIESIDFLNKLSVSPLSDFGKEMYFGLDGVDDVYKFARADDFDAFLWFVIHKGHFPNSSDFSAISARTSNGLVSVKPSGATLLETVEVMTENGGASNILAGNTFTYSGSTQVISMCIDTSYDKNSNNIIKNTLLPISDDWNSVNWYARRADQLGKNIGFGWGVNQNNANTKYKGKSRDFNKEHGICNLQFLDQASATDTLSNGLVNNKLRFTILPKPFLHVPNIDNGEPPWRFKKLLFNAKGEYDPNGKYTIPANYNDGLEITVGNAKINIDHKSGNVKVTNPNELVKHLIECYQGLTVYEFNYDYLMSLKLFDAKVMATMLLDSIIDTRVGVNLRFGRDMQEGTDKIKEIVQNIVNSDDSTVSDCFYTFDNSKYDNLLRITEEKKAQYRKITEILNEYSENAELHEQIDVLNRAIKQASVIASSGADEKDKSQVEMNFVTDLIERLTMAIVYAILSPKVLLLLEVNETLMGGKWENFTVKDLIKKMTEVIVSIVKEVRDLVAQELLKLVIKQLSPIIATINGIILREQLENYAEIINDIIRNCPMIWFSLGSKNTNTVLDDVYYADIETSENKEQETPKNNNC